MIPEKVWEATTEIRAVEMLPRVHLKKSPEPVHCIFIYELFKTPFNGKIGKIFLLALIVLIGALKRQGNNSFNGQGTAGHLQWAVASPGDDLRNSFSSQPTDKKGQTE